MIACSSRIAASTRASVEKPVLPRRFFDRPSFSNRIVAELLRRADRELLARELLDLALELGAPRRPRARSRASRAVSSLMPARSISTQHVDERQLDLAQQAREPLLLDHLALALAPARACTTARAASPFRALDLGRDARVLAAARRAGNCAAPGRSGRRRPSCRARAAAAPGRPARERLPVVRDDRALAPARAQRGERLRARRRAPRHRRRRRRSAAARAPRSSSSSDARARPPASASSPSSAAPARRPAPRPRLRREHERRRSAAAPPPPRRPCASSRRRSGSRSSNSRKTSRSRERSGACGGDTASRSIVDRHVADRGGELLRHARVVRVVGQVLLALGAGDLVDVRQHSSSVAVLLEQLRRRSCRRCRGRPGCCPRCRPSGRRSRGSAPAGCRSARSPPRGRRSSVSVIPRPVAITRTPSSISWNASRSPVTTVTSIPFSCACVARVAITSSASKPSTRTFW